MKNGGKAKDVLDVSIEQHATIIMENALDVFDALDLVKILEIDVKSRVKHFSYCISKSTENYRDWLKNEYMRKLTLIIRNRYSETI
jgi:flavorubredoxin